MFKWAKEQKIHDAGFAKGLMFGKAVATRDEQERIIKLLEDDYWHHLSYFPRLETDKAKLVHAKECLGCQLIALIKGEK